MGTVDLELKEELELPVKETKNLLQDNDASATKSVFELAVGFYGMALPAILGALVF